MQNNNFYVENQYQVPQQGAAFMNQVYKMQNMAICQVKKEAGQEPLFFDNVISPKRIFLDCISKFEISRMDIGDGTYRLIIIEINEKVIVLREKDLKPARIYDAFLKKGFRFNLSISKGRIGSALCDYINQTIGQSERCIAISGDAGWENGIFKSAENFRFLSSCAAELDIPVLHKHFNRHTIDFARIDDYTNHLKTIVNPKDRILVALTPFAGILYTIFAEKGFPAPFVLNFVLMTDKCNLQQIASFVKIFNRDQPTRPLCAALSAKEMAKNIRASKDEVIIFTGFSREYDSYYDRQKTMRSLNLLAQNALGQNGAFYGENAFRSVLALISDHQILFPGVKKVFIDEDFFSGGKALYRFDVMEKIFSFFIEYIENVWEDIQNIMTTELQEIGKNYWQVLWHIVDDFCRVLDHRFYEVLELEKSFDISFLWTEERMEENGVEQMKKAVRRDIKKIPVVDKERCTKDAFFLYDAQYIWIETRLFTEILKRNRLKNFKNEILMECKNQEILVTDSYGRGFVTRLQMAGVRRDFYKFDRSKFTEAGEVELIDLIGGAGC